MHTSQARSATLWLWGHGRRAAELEIERYSAWAWVGRILLAVTTWSGGTLITLLVTFDPFVASFPFVLGLGLVHHNVRGRYRVRAFAGACPRCNNELQLKPGSRINLPHRLDCFHCHFEPELRLELAQNGTDHPSPPRWAEAKAHIRHHRSDVRHDGAMEEP